ncbi:MAG: membrane protein insertion efficiency factor YidD [Deltaproteobacteria bacterium]|nr:membrane protein insertion efficiency factor YidD [Deltaproteobacteria bacterium]
MIKKPILWLISLYRIALSPVLPPSCRFYPSCSEYAHGAIEGHGVARGVFLAVKRVLRCHPYNPGGYDPVPAVDNAPRRSRQIRKDRQAFNG